MDDVAEKIIAILRKNMRDQSKEITLDTKLTDLEIESLDLAVIVFDIEDTFGIQIPYNANEEVQDFATVGSVVERVKAVLAGSQASNAAVKSAASGSNMAQNGKGRRVAVTGMGVVSPLGTGMAKFWAAIKQGECGIGPIEGIRPAGSVYHDRGRSPRFRSQNLIANPRPSSACRPLFAICGCRR